MTKSQTLALELSEKREKLNKLNLLDDLSTEQKTERDALTTRLVEIEPEIRAAMVAENVTETNTLGDDAENRELRALTDKASVGEILQAGIERRAIAGAEKELQDHYGLKSNMIPVTMLRSGRETRAVTPSPTNVGTNQQAIIPGVFPQACGSFLGVDMPTVGVGEVVYPVLTTNAIPGTPAEGAIPSGTGIDSEGATTGAFSAEVLSPGRIQAAFFYSRESVARFDMMDESLRQNLGDALADGLDDQILSGTNGLFTSTNLSNHNVSAVTSYALYKSQLAYGRVDGMWASGVGDLRIVCGSGTYAHAATQYRGNNADQSALDELIEKTGGVKVSAHVPAVASSKQNAVVRLGMRRDMVAPVWMGVSLIFDELTLVDKGQIKITATMLYAVRILRADGFYKQQTQHA